MGPARTTALAAGFAVLAAFVWSTYYFFVLDLQARGVGEIEITAIPFLAGGLVYLAYAASDRTLDHLRTVARDPGAYARIGLLLAMQLTVLASTYGLGAVDTSLLTLLGDVVLTSVLVMVLFGEGRERLRSGLFLAGVGLSVLGAGLTIVAGGSTRPIVGAEWGVALALPFAVALYFIWTARVGRTVPTSALLTHATLGAALVTLVAGGFLPAWSSGLFALTPLEWGLLVVNGVLSFFVGPWLYFRAIHWVGLILPSVLMAMIPVFTLLLGLVLLGSFPPWLGSAGIPLAAGGSYLALRGESAASGSTAPVASSP